MRNVNASRPYQSRKRRRLFWTICLVFALVTFAFTLRPSQGRIQAERWKLADEPIMVGTETWEGDAVGEPVVLYDRAAGLYRMWYTAGWERAALGTATSLDGVHWIKAAENPVIGLGGSAFTGEACRPAVVQANGVYYAFFVDGTTGVGDQLRVGTSADGIRWDVAPKAVLQPPHWATGIANTAVWTNGQAWRMLFEAKDRSGIWRMSSAEGTDPFHWTPAAAPIETLSVGGMYGGPWLIWSGEAFHLWYHAARRGLLPTDIYYRSSRTIDAWSSGDGTPVVMRPKIDGVDQVADPSVVDDGIRIRMYFSLTDNTDHTSAIGMAAFDGSLAQLVGG